MDHIPCVESHLWEHIRVPFLGNEEYDGLGFADFPVRKKWQDASDATPDTIRLAGRSAQEQSSFFQAWLFFGMLTEVLSVEIAIQDFVVDGFVTTKRLPHYTSAWYKNVHAMSDDQRHDCFMRSERNLLAARVCRFSLLDKSQRPDCLVTPEIRLSISILGETLGQVHYSIRQSFESRAPGGYIDTRNKWGYNRMILHKLLLEPKQWCPNHIAFLENYPPASTNILLYYAASLDRPRMGYHGDCSVHACMVGKVRNPKAYKTRHSDSSDPPCDGRCPEIEPTQAHILVILEEGGLPLLRASVSDYGTVNVEVINYKTGMEYTAISHVWSDGLGNENNSWLPQCQFAALIKAVNAAQRQRNTSHRNNASSTDVDGTGTTTPSATFWIDTICVPRGAAAARFRRMALDRMAIPYQLATTVLVLDAELYHTDLPSTSSEAIVRLICSNWMRRLWTLQESILGAERLSVLFKERRVFHLWEELETLRKDLWAQPWVPNPLVPIAMRTGIQQSARALPGSSSKLSWLFRDMSWRSTTRRTDEALVLSNMLGVIPPNMFQIPAEDRMRAVIAELPEFPRRVIFAPGPRSPQEGFRWLVHSFLDKAAFGLGVTVGKIRNRRFHHMETECPCLEVSYPGYVLRAPKELVRRPWDFVLCDPSTDKIIHITEKPGEWQSHQQSTENFGRSLETNRPGSSMSDSHRLLGLVLHHDALALHTIHRYAAVMELDQTINGPTPEVLSGRHQGAVGVSVYKTGQSREMDRRLCDHHDPILIDFFVPQGSLGKPNRPNGGTANHSDWV
ncbi:uncharacterized protein BDR25DRAFT_313370 [Lindgomyces ingoldianus]|uniref:Uncharacterized protein n=1 Tax=Lindgomyces ingoldianus TaxID=673940 RepID=A0ACB6QYV7_9PLEO|nr:uncharacterized protein BDR25DRAFT_313370 [Lindgomyces ingoldianus]KAF2472203.1 hypothetical protein BDR25DRAFT_313370 [Lindgomyces ingoldianus]